MKEKIMEKISKLLEGSSLGIWINAIMGSGTSDKTKINNNEENSVDKAFQRAYTNIGDAPFFDSLYVPKTEPKTSANKPRSTSHSDKHSKGVVKPLEDDREY